MMKNVLVAFDFSDLSETALVYARNLARTFGGRLHLLHVSDNDFLRPTAADPRTLEEATARHLADKLTESDRTALQATAVVRKSNDPAYEILQYAESENVDLIVMGTHGRKGIAHLVVGSVAERVVRSAHCPVLTVRNPQAERVSEMLKHSLSTVV
jgi:nucleotide-binding universal stress UspA family protein